MQQNSDYMYQGIVSMTVRLFHDFIREDKGLASLCEVNALQRPITLYSSPIASFTCRGYYTEPPLNQTQQQFCKQKLRQ